MVDLAIASGPLPASLSNAVSDAIFAAINAGMEVDEACSIVVAVVADYWKQAYQMDAAAVAGLSEVMLRRASKP